MKKLISVILALVLCLSVASALAEEPSPKTKDTLKIVVIKGNGKVTFDYTTDLAKEVSDTIKEDGMFNPLVEVEEVAKYANEWLEVEPEQVDAKEVAGFKYETPGDDEDVVIQITAATVAANEKVLIAIGVPSDDDISWYGLLEAPTTANGKGEVEVTIPADLVEVINGVDCVLAVMGVK